MNPSTQFRCYICSDPSTRICLYCTKDACDNHVCEKCGRCSDCCTCEVHLDETPQEAGLPGRTSAGATPPAASGDPQ